MPLRLVRYRHRSTHWYLRGTIRGQRVFETTGTDDAQAAEAIRIKREGALLNRSVFGPGATVTFAEAAASYLEQGGEARYLGKFDEETGKWSLLIGHFGSTPIARIGQAEVDEAAKKLYPTAKASTRKRHVYVPMAAVLNHAAGKKWITPPRFHHPKVPIAETHYSTPERLEKLLPHCSPKLARLVIFLTYTGCRISEALRLDWDRDIDLSLRRAYLRRVKGGKARTVPLAVPVMVALASVPEADRHGQVFAWKYRHGVYKPLQRACRLAGVDYLPPHQQGRHTFASWLRIYGGRDLKGLMADGGWQSVQSVLRYAHLAVGETAEAVAKLPVVGQPKADVCTMREPRPVKH